MNKELFHRAGKRQLKIVAEKLGLEKESYSIRSCLGGPGVMGEVTLHADSIYIMVYHAGPAGVRVMYRACKGRKDYCGGPNRYMLFDYLTKDSAIETFKNLS